MNDIILHLIFLLFDKMQLTNIKYKNATVKIFVLYDSCIISTYFVHIVCAKNEYVPTVIFGMYNAV